MIIKKNMTKEIFSIALPMTAETILETLVGAIDVWIVSQIGLSAVTAVGVSNNLMAVYLAIFIALGVGASSILSEKIGAAKKNEAAALTKFILRITIIIGVFLGGITIIFGRFMLQAMGLNEELVDLGYKYTLLVGGTALLMGSITIISNMLRVVRNTKYPLTVSIIVNILNTLLSLTFAFVFSFGIVGVALGTVLSRLAGVSLLFFRLKKTDLWKSSKEPVQVNKNQFFIMTLPILVERMIMRGGQVIYMTMIVSISSMTYAAHNIAGTIESFTYMPAYGFAAAATILVARSIGEKNKTHLRQAMQLSLRYCILILTIFAIIQGIGASLWAQIFTQDEMVFPLIIKALYLSALGQPFIAISQVLAGALQGARDTRSPFYSTVIGMFAIRILGIYWMGIHLEWGISGVWLAILFDLIFRSIFLSIRWHTLQSRL